jgi:glycosyltransferase involved in cell wall biosynthesis
VRPLKVCHVTTIDWALHGLLLNQLQDFRQAGYEVSGISSDGEMVPRIEAAGIRHLPVKMTRNFTPLHDLVALWKLYCTMRREGFTIVHTHNPKPGLLGQLAARLAGVPVVVNTVHGFYFHDHMHPAWRRFYVTLERIAARCSDVILSQNSEDIQTAVAERICTPDKIRYLGNGIDVQRFDPATVSLDDVVRKRNELGLPVESLVVGFVGRLVREKGLLELFSAARLVRQRVANVRFLFIGPIDPHKPDAVTPETARELGIADISYFSGGWRWDMPELYAAMDVLVLPSHREGFPRVPMEASAMKIPCIATDIRGCREAVLHNRNGLLVPVCDDRTLADAIVELLMDREKAQRLGEEGRRLALERFDERLVFDKVKAEYARLLQEKGLPVPEFQSPPMEAPV